MKKYILILVASLGLTACSYGPMNNPDQALINKDQAYKNYGQVFVNEQTSEVLDKTYELTEQIKDGDFRYIARFKDSNQAQEEDLLISRQELGGELFQDMIELLDQSIGQGLKDYYASMELGDSRQAFDQVVIDQNQDGPYLIINLLDIKDPKIKEIYREVFKGKYKISTALANEAYFYLEIGQNSYNDYREAFFDLSYGLIFKDYDLEKVNLYFNRYKKGELDQYDLDSFINLLDYLGLENRQELLEDFKEIGSGNLGKKSYDLDGYKIVIVDIDKSLERENSREWSQAYMSIERN